MSDLIERLREEAETHRIGDCEPGTAALLREAAAALEAYATCPDAINALQALVRDQKAALEAAREDAERLDWLASEAATLWGSRDRGGYELPYFDINSGRECCDPSDLRAAIDQARGKGTDHD